MLRRDFFKGALAIMAAPLLSLLPESAPDLTDASNDLPKIKETIGGEWDEGPSCDHLAIGFIACQGADLRIDSDAGSVVYRDGTTIRNSGVSGNVRLYTRATKPGGSVYIYDSLFYREGPLPVQKEAR